MPLVIFIVSLTGFIMFTLLLVIFLAQIGLNNVERNIKFSIMLLLFLNFALLAVNSIRFYFSIAENSEESVLTSIIASLVLFVMVTIYFRFTFEMGEVYTKITSDNPTVFEKNLRMLKNTFILVYFLEAIGFLLYIFETIHQPIITP